MNINAESKGPQYVVDRTPDAGSPQPTPPPPSAADSTPPRGEAQMVNTASQMLARFLINNDYHPVILCGTSQAGKTTMLASLCAFLSTCGTASFDFGEWYDQGDSSEAREQLDEAQRFFRDMVYQFRHGVAPDGTHFHLPYIVPLKITATNIDMMPRGGDGRPRSAKFAIMDMRGEFFKPNPVDIFRPMHAETEALLHAFERGISMVYLAPVSRIDGYTGQNGQHEPHQVADGTTAFLEDPDAALVNAIKGYERVRPTRAHDRHLYILSKWDLHTHGPESDEFATPDERAVESILQRQFASSWAAFRAMRAAQRAKWFMQYSAGVISGRQIIQPQGESVESMRRYSKVIWNWLYEGAARSGEQEGAPLLFPDIVPKRASWYERLLAGQSLR
jgi:hypothetical protein